MFHAWPCSNIFLTLAENDLENPNKNPNKNTNTNTITLIPTLTENDLAKDWPEVTTVRTTGELLDKPMSMYTA